MRFETLAGELDAVGLDEDQGEVYLRLLQTGPAKAAKLTQFFSCSRSTLYRLLDELADRGCITKSLEQPTVFEAIPPDELFEMGEAELRRSRERLQRVRERCEEDLETIAGASDASVTEDQWRKMEGTSRIYRTLHAMMEHACESVWSASNHEITFAGHLPDVEEAWRLGYRRAREDELDVRLLFDLGEDPYAAVPDWVGDTPTFQLRDLEADSTIHFVLVDERELLMWVRPAPLGNLGKRDDVAVHTDAPGSVFAHRMLFDRLWAEAEPVKIPSAKG